MHLRSLKHLLQAVSSLVQSERIVVLGSSSLLASTSLSLQVAALLELTLDADLLPSPIDARTADIIHEAVGEGSFFHERYGCYAEIMTPDITETLPDGWATRLIPIEGLANVFCLEPHDLALVKLSVGRAKDIQLVETLLKTNVLSRTELQRRFQSLRWDEHRLLITGRRLTQLLNTIK